METLYDFFAKPTDPLQVPGDPDRAGLAGADPEMVPRRDQEAGDHQLPDVQAGARRAFLRQDFRSHQGLRVQLRQVQAHEAPRRDLREVRGRGHPVQGAARAHGAYRAGHPRLPHLVSEEPAEQDRQPAGLDPQEHGEGPLLRQLHRARSQGHPAPARPAALRGKVPGSRGDLRHQVRGRHRRRSGQDDAREASISKKLYNELRTGDPRDRFGRQAPEAGQAAEDRGRLPAVGNRPDLDDHGRHPGAAAGSAAAGAAGRRAFRHLRSERSLSPGDQPQQPAADG